jgi:HAD superfamily hydrolase (TIGR01509 family)
MRLSAYELVIFDCDGVLVDSERLTVVEESRMLAELGWPMEPEEVVARFMGRSLASELAEIADHLGQDAADRFEEELVPRLTAIFDAELTTIDGVPELLADLSARGVPTCVASSGTPDGIRHKLDITGLRDHFGERISSSVEVEHGKPAPDLFLLAASRMGADPRRTAVLEDSVHGVTAGVAAGMTVFGYGGGLADTDELAAAGAVVFDSMAELGEDRSSTG